MAELELKFSADLKNAQLGTVAAAQICKELYRLASAERSFKAGEEKTADNAQFIEDVEICVGEACTNAVKHCSHPDPSSCAVIVSFRIESMTCSPETKNKTEHPKDNAADADHAAADSDSDSDSGSRLVISVKDQNGEFDFYNVPEVDFEAFQESGYGIFIMKEKMDQVIYQYRDGWNIVTMIKKID